MLHVCCMGCHGLSQPFGVILGALKHRGGRAAFHGTGSSGARCAWRWLADRPRIEVFSSAWAPNHSTGLRLSDFADLFLRLCAQDGLCRASFPGMPPGIYVCLGQRGLSAAAVRAGFDWAEEWHVGMARRDRGSCRRDSGNCDGRDCAAGLAPLFACSADGRHLCCAADCVHRHFFGDIGLGGASSSCRVRNGRGVLGIGALLLQLAALEFSSGLETRTAKSST
mmetsp:Transcript_30077/g.71575  ORF Transcript_30077/g.71575 Transcript_30077/m.71575 type:complete len:224 (-) Transcript_30077:449-1120(-)